MSFKALAGVSDNDYSAGPWCHGKQYSEPTLEGRLDSELRDLTEWLKPTESERQLRLLTIRKFINVIEASFVGATCVLQGSSATDTYLPSSDIDLIVFNLPNGMDPVIGLKLLTKICFRAKIISSGFVIPGARVPIAKYTERPFGFQIDVAMSNINGALNVPRVKSTLNQTPLLRPILTFLKVFVFVQKLDDPAKGGFGSTQLLNLAHFAIQKLSGTESLGKVLIFLLDIIANRLNFFMAGISTVGGGSLFSKLKSNLISERFPPALLIEDPQFHGCVIGAGSKQIFDLAKECGAALETLKSSDPIVESPLTSIFYDLPDIVHRRTEIKRYSSWLDKDPQVFELYVRDVPMCQRPHMNDNARAPMNRRGISPNVSRSSSRESLDRDTRKKNKQKRLSKRSDSAAKAKKREDKKVDQRKPIKSSSQRRSRTPQVKDKIRRRN